MYSLRSGGLRSSSRTRGVDSAFSVFFPGKAGYPPLEQAPSRALSFFPSMRGKPRRAAERSLVLTDALLEANGFCGFSPDS